MDRGADRKAKVSVAQIRPLAVQQAWVCDCHCSSASASEFFLALLGKKLTGVGKLKPISRTSAAVVKVHPS